MNYTLQEYANDIVFGTMELCDAAGVPHPTLVSESGRALVAHHAVLVTDVLGVGEFDGRPAARVARGRHAGTHAATSSTPFARSTRKNLLEAYHDAVGYRDEVLSLFNLGHLTLEHRVLAEDLFWALCDKILKLVRDLPEVPEELEGLERALSDTYFCNFSVFQSLPDSWAIDQLFPIMPIHRLRRGADPARRARRHHLRLRRQDRPLHRPPRRQGRPRAALAAATSDYYLGIFLVGAYQEILGDLHNLFGDTNTVHVSLGDGGEYHIDHVVTGDTVSDVLRYVSYDRADLIAQMRRFAEKALRSKRITLEESRQLLRVYEEGLSGYTYLERD